nr:aminotransferase class V-fold PLP-dependent enzyme [Kineosporia babensis]
MTHRPAPPALLTAEGRPAIADWSLTPHRIHLNHGSFGAVPRAAQAVLQNLRDQMEANPCAWFMPLPQRVKAARTQVAAFLGVAAEETAFVPNASAGVSTVLNTVVREPGSRVLTTSHAYGAVREACARAAKRVNGHLDIAELPLGAAAETVVSALENSLTEQTALIVIDQVTSASARLFPVGQIVRLAAQRNIPVLIDGAHATAVIERPVPEGDVFWVGNLHKFGCAPRGTAVLVARGAQAPQLTPLIDSWGFPYPYPDNFDHVGTQDNVSWLAAPVALDFIEQNYGWNTFRRHAQELCDYGEDVITGAFEAATGENVRVDVGLPVGPMRLLALPSGLAETHEDSHLVRAFIADEFSFETAITSLDGRGYLRLSAHLYNTAGDYETFAEKVVPALVRFARNRA